MRAGKTSKQQLGMMADPVAFYYKYYDIGVNSIDFKKLSCVFSVHWYLF